MRLPDLDLKGGWIKVRGKTGERLVSLSDETVEAIKAYLEASERIRGEEKALWLDMDGSPMSDGAVRRLFRDLQEKFPEHKRLLHAHTFRHTCATRLLEAGMDVRMVQRHLGHASIGMTQHYTSQLRDDIVAKAHKRLSPVRNILR